jgi:hypothetical protein
VRNVDQQGGVASDPIHSRRPHQKHDRLLPATQLGETSGSPAPCSTVPGIPLPPVERCPNGWDLDDRVAGGMAR